MSTRKSSRLGKRVRDKARSVRDQARRWYRGRGSKSARAAKRLYWTISTPFHRILGETTVRVTMPADKSDTVQVVDLNSSVRLRFQRDGSDKRLLLLERFDDGIWKPVGRYSDHLEAACEGVRQVVQARFESQTANHPTDLQKTWIAIAEDRHAPRMLRLDEQWQTALHRSGWGYALEPLSSLHDERGVLFDGFLESTFSWRDTGRVYRKPWVGVVHNPPQTPKWYSEGQGTNRYMMSSPRWRESHATCQGLFVLSDYHRQALKRRVQVPVSVLTHPTETPRQKFDPHAFRRNPSPKLVQIGAWLRNPNSIYKLHSPNLTKARLDVGYPWEEDVRRHMPRESLDLDSVEVIPRLDDDAYDTLLSENVVFLDLIDASANNAVIECIVRHTPLLVNRHPAVVEYLGPGYPLYFRNLDEAGRKAADRELILRAHEYLRDLPKQRFTQEAFLQQVIRSDVYQSLLPSSVEPFVLLAHARCGSTSLMNALNAHKQLRIINEPLSPTRNPWGYPYADDVTDEASLQRTLDELYHFHTGIKHLICQLPPEGNERILRCIKRTILLRRRNLLQAVVSEMIAWQTNVWHGANRQLKRAKLKPLDLDELARLIAVEREQVDDQRRRLARSGRPFCEVFYEDLFGPAVPIRDRLRTYAQLLDFLGAEAADETTLEEVSRVFDPAESKLTTESTYRKLPNAAQIDLRLGNPRTGFLFDQGDYRERRTA